MENTANMLVHRLNRLVSETGDPEQLSEALYRLLELERARFAQADDKESDE